jgi:hypothetical protein
MNLILEKTDQVSFFTNMKEIFAAAEIAPQDYDWYVSDMETNFTPEGLDVGDQWMRGEELACLIHKQEIQFIWAVFSAVPKGSRPAVSEPPYVDGNPDYWNGNYHDHGHLAPIYLFDFYWDLGGVRANAAYRTSAAGSQRAHCRG